MPGNDKTQYDGKSTIQDEETPYNEGSTIQDLAITGFIDQENTIEKGATLLGTYHVESDAIEGGMGRVWRIRHTGWNVDLALKQPKHELFHSDRQKENFAHECEAWINLGLHPNIVSCYYVLETFGIPSIFSEWMDGGSLKNWIYPKAGEECGRLYEGDEKAVLQRILDISIQFARGLHYAHEQGLIHQDVKPDNLLLTQEGDVKVADFGVARARVALSIENTGLSGSGTIVSDAGGYTPAYCSPEQVEGGLLTRRTDIYSFAVSVLEMFLGDKPWTSGVVAGEACEDYFGMAMRANMPDHMQALLKECLNKEPDMRPRSFAAVAEKLEKIYQALTGSAYPGEISKAAEDTPDSLNNRALSYLDLGRGKEAAMLWEKALETNPGHVNALYNLSLYRWRNGEIDSNQCLSALMNNYSLHQDDECAYMLANFFLESGDADRAKLYIEKIKAKKDFSFIEQMLSHLKTLKPPRLISIDGLRGAVMDGKYFFSWAPHFGIEGHTWFYDSETLAPVRHFEKYAEAFSPDSKYVLAREGYADESFDMLESETGKSIVRFEVGSPIEELAFSKDMKQVRVLTRDSILKTYDIGSGVLVAESEKIKEGDRFFSPHMEYVVYHEALGDTVLVHIDDAKKTTIDGYVNYDNIPGFSRDESLLLISNFEKSKCILYDTNTGERLNIYFHEAERIVFCRDMRYVVTEKKAYTLSLMDLSNGRVLCAFETRHRPEFFFDINNGMCVAGYIEYSLAEYERLKKIDDEKLKKDYMQVLTFAPSGFLAPFMLNRIVNTKKQIENERLSSALLQSIREALQRLEIKVALSLLQSREESGIKNNDKYMELNDIIGNYCTVSGLESCVLVSQAECPRNNFACFRPHTDTFFLVDCEHYVATNRTAECRNMYTSGLIQEYFDERYTGFPTSKLFFDKSGMYMLDGKTDDWNRERQILVLWDLHSGKTREYLRVESAYKCVLFGGAGQVFYHLGESEDHYYHGGCEDTYCRNWADLEVKGVFQHADRKKGTDSICLNASEDTLYLSGEGALSIWSLNDKSSEIVKFKGMQDFFLSPDDRHGVYFTPQKLNIIDMSSLKKIRSRKIDEGNVRAACFSPDGGYILFALPGQKLRMMHIPSGKTVLEMKTAGEVQSLDFHTKGRHMLVSTTEKISVYRLCYRYDFPGFMDWDDGALPYAKAFLALRPEYTEAEFRDLITELQRRGYGWLRPEGVLAKIDELQFG